MGEVFRATDTRLNRTVAVKISSALFAPRPAREPAQSLPLNHPHICTVHDVGEVRAGRQMPRFQVYAIPEDNNFAER